MCAYTKITVVSLVALPIHAETFFREMATSTYYRANTFISINRNIYMVFMYV